jgi:transcription initiation factor TFIID subunit 1, fungi type
MADIYQQANELDDLFGNDGDDDMMDTMTTTPGDESFNMPAAMGGSGGDMEALLAEMRAAGGESIDLNTLNDTEIERTEKADDAVDYADIDLSDEDDLPDDQLKQNGHVDIPTDMLPEGVEDSDLFGAEDDDLFGDPMPVDTTAHLPVQTPLVETPARDPDTPGDGSDLAEDESQNLPAPSPAAASPEEDDEQWRIQQALFNLSGKPAPTTQEENYDEWLKLEFPGFDRNEVPFFNKLFPPRPFKWPGKAPAKPPKPIRPSKVNLEIEQDQRLAFTSAVPVSGQPVGVDLVKTTEPALEHHEEEASEESDWDEPLPGGITLDDLEFMCADFDTLSHLAPSDGESQFEPRIFDGDHDMLHFEQPRKKRRLGRDPEELVAIHQIELPYFDDPEKLTQKLAAKVVLDLNDTDLLVEEIDQDAARAKSRLGEKANAARTLKDRLNARFKISNDAEYDLLKQNHHSKIRGQLTTLTIEHSMVATRLQYPYYPVRLSLQQSRNFHRKKLAFKFPIGFKPLSKVKRKHQKQKTIPELYSTTKDLSMADNSSTILLEYSEEHPLMMSLTGMGNKVINYYRKKTPDDTFRPKLDIGEISTLLPEDKSPFHIFGHIDPGETMTALYNSMYRAPIFQQNPNTGDFLVLRETTGINGEWHYIRNLENVYVVGQELPSVTIPGTHSRMVTTASKNRLKAISFRVARKRKHKRIRVEDVTKHFPDTTDMQNRQKMKEFMRFSKEAKEWEMPPGHEMPSESTIQTFIRPEDICLLESMQVGSQYLQDAGYADNDNEDDDGRENDGDSIEQQLAPWRTTKNFMQATQGKAMLKLFGEGDPSGRGEAFSFIKTSMKGGFRPIGGSAMDAMALKKELGGHSYNVARQQKSYEESIRGIWDKQKASLSSAIEPTDLDQDGDVDGQEYRESRNVRATPTSGTQTPSVARRARDDDTATSFSRRSLGSQTQRILKISRTIKMADGTEEEQTFLESDPAVIKQYLKFKELEEMQATR